MQTSIDQTKWYDRIWAALIFFTRLPFWRLHQPPKECYTTVVEHWPLAGWITGGAMGLTIYLACIGGGNNRRRILEIMKDSHIGTYGVLGLVFYELLLAATLMSIPPYDAAMMVLAGDTYSKMVTSQLVLMMPYARREEEAKAKTVYRKFGVWSGISLALQGLPPMLFFIWMTGLDWQMMIFIPALVFYLLYLLIWRKIQGYTGDCCGAVCLLVELAVYLVVCAINFMNPL